MVGVECSGLGCCLRGRAQEFAPLRHAVEERGAALMLRQGRPLGPPHWHRRFCWGRRLVRMSSGGGDRPLLLLLLRMLWHTEACFKPLVGGTSFPNSHKGNRNRNPKPTKGIPGTLRTLNIAESICRSPCSGYSSSYFHCLSILLTCMIAKYCKASIWSCSFAGT